MMEVIKSKKVQWLITFGSLNMGKGELRMKFFPINQLMLSLTKKIFGSTFNILIPLGYFMTFITTLSGNVS
jgi:hypothetical protein